VYCRGGLPTYFSRIGRPVHFVHAEPFRVAAAGSDVAVVVCARGWARDYPFVTFLLELPSHLPTSAIIVVAPRDLELALRLRSDQYTVIWEDDVDRTLPESLSAAFVPHPTTIRIRLSSILTSQPGVIGQVGRTLNRQPVVLVRAVAAELGYSPSHLEALWAASTSGLRLKQVVDAILMCRAVELAVAGMTREQVSTALGVSVTTLGRLSLRLTGMTFARTKSAEGRRVLRRRLYALFSCIESPG